jgi:hypothetical protein
MQLLPFLKKKKKQNRYAHKNHTGHYSFKIIKDIKMNKENELQISSCISTKQCSNTTADA